MLSDVRIIGVTKCWFEICCVYTTNQTSSVNLYHHHHQALIRHQKDCPPIQCLYLVLSMVVAAPSIETEGGYDWGVSTRSHTHPRERVSIHKNSVRGSRCSQAFFTTQHCSIPVHVSVGIMLWSRMSIGCVVGDQRG